MKLLDNIKIWLDRDQSVKRVAEDLQITSELILLVRMIFADGELKKREMKAFNRICESFFGIPQEDVPQVISYLKDFGYETTVSDAAIMFQEMPAERKSKLLLHMLSIAKADAHIHEDEIQLIRKTADILGVDAETLQNLERSEIERSD